MVETAVPERRKPRRKLSVARLCILVTILVTLACVWWLQRRDRLDQALLLAVLEGDRGRAHSLLESGANANVYFGAFSARQQNTGLLEWFMNLIRTRRVERRPNDRTALFAAVSSADVVIARDLLDHGANANVSAGRGMTPLLTAVSRSDPGLPLLLLDRGANWKVRTTDGMSTLQLAARIGNVPVVKALIDRGASITDTDKRGWTPLMVAAENKHDTCVKLLLERGARLEELNASGQDPLLWAATVGSTELIARLWTEMTRAERQAKGPQALQQAVISRRVEAVTAMLDRGVKPTRDPKTGMSAVVIAAGSNTRDILALLLDHGANINERDLSGATALMRAQNFPDMIAFLLKRGADPNAADSSGRTPLFQAFDASAINLLLDAGANPNIRDKSGATAIHYAFNPATAQMLLRRGADPNVADKTGTTPLMKAVNQLNQGLVQVLLGHGARINEADAIGQTALAIAQRSGTRAPVTHPTIIEMLKAKGAVASVQRSQWRGTPMSSQPLPIVRTRPVGIVGGFGGAGAFNVQGGGALPAATQRGASPGTAPFNAPTSPPSPKH